MIAKRSRPVCTSHRHHTANGERQCGKNWAMHDRIELVVRAKSTG